MIRTVPIPKTVGRIGCAPGADCCDDCRKHKLGDVASDLTAAESAFLNNPNSVCDQDGNCYDTTTGALLSSAVSSGGGSSSSTAVLYVAGAVLLLIGLETSGRNRR